MTGRGCDCAEPSCEDYDRMRAFRCPGCGGGEFDLTLFGRNSGRIDCANPDCRYVVVPGRSQSREAGVTTATGG